MENTISISIKCNSAAEEYRMSFLNHSDSIPSKENIDFTNVISKIILSFFNRIL